MVSRSMANRRCRRISLIFPTPIPTRRRRRAAARQARGFASLNPFNAKFSDAPQLVIGNVVQSLMTRSQDEPYSLYPLIAQSVDIDDAREHVTFHLDPRARFSDKTPIVASDVLFSFELLKSKVGRIIA